MWDGVSTEAFDAAVLDVGSNSVRLVIYRIDGRALWTVYNEKVVAAGAFKMTDFTVVPTTRFGQAGTTLLNGGAECALIDDAQLAALAKTPGGADVKTVWSSGPNWISTGPTALSTRWHFR